MADLNRKPYNSADPFPDDAMNTLASQLIEYEALIQGVINVASNFQDEIGSSYIHTLLLDSQHKRYIGRARLKDMIDAHRYKEHIRAACGINVVDFGWLTFDEKESEHKPDDLSITGYPGYVRNWLKEKLDPEEAEIDTKSEPTEVYGIQEGVDYDFDDDDNKTVIIKRVMRYERDLYYMFHDFLKTIRNTRDPEGKATTYQEFKDCLKWLGSGVDNQVMRCSQLILNTVNNGLERVIGISRKGKEIVSDKKNRVDKIFDLFLRLIQHVSVLWLGTNWLSTEDDDSRTMLSHCTDGCKGGFEETRLVVKEWLDTLQCRHCSRSRHP